MSPPDNIERHHAGQYLRVSVDKSGRARSLDEQEIENGRDATAHGWELVRSYRDPNRSASRYATKAREAYAALLADLEHGLLDVLILWEPSRGSRKVSEWVRLIELCEESAVLIHVTSHGRSYDVTRPRDRRSLLEDAVDSEYESGKTSERLLRTARAGAAAGRPHGTVPYGYTRERDVRTGAVAAQVLDPQTAPVVQELVARVIAGDTLYSIAADLNRRGIPTPQGYKELAAGIDRGRVWSSATIRVLLASQSMTGVRTHLGVAHPEQTWEPIVSGADWLRARGVLADPWRARHHGGVEARHLLSGIAECGAVLDSGVCGAWLRARSNRGRPVYQCDGHGVGDPRGKGHVSRGPRVELDAMVVTKVIGKLSDPQLPRDIAARAGVVRDGADRVEAELAGLRRELAGIEQAAVAVRGTAAAALVRIIADLGEQIDAREAQLVAAAPVGLADVLAVAGPDAAARWGGLQVAQQRRLIRALVRVVVSRSGCPRGQRGFDRDTVAISPRL